MTLELHWHNVESSNLEKVAWHPTAGLLVEFKTGAIYLYPTVERDTFVALLESNSKGRFFHQEIRNVHEFTKIDPGVPLVDQVHQARATLGAERSSAAGRATLVGSAGSA